MMTALKPKRRFGKDYKDEIRISKEALFKGVSTRFGLRTIEKSIETSGFRLLSIRLKSSFGGMNLMLATGMTS
jgi:hypothetical protein